MTDGVEGGELCLDVSPMDDNGCTAFSAIGMGLMVTYAGRAKETRGHRKVSESMTSKSYFVKRRFGERRRVELSNWTREKRKVA